MIWPTKKLNEIAIVNPKKSEIKECSADMDVSFVPMVAVDEVSQSIKYVEVRKLGAVRKGYTYFREGDVLFAKITPCMENGKVAIARNLKNGIGFGSTEFHVIRPTKSVSPEWIYYIVGSSIFREEAKRNMTGTAGQQRVPEDYLANFEIHLPPIDEQKKIVEKIEKLFAKIDEVAALRQSALEDSKAILPATFNKVFKGVASSKWKTKKIIDVCDLKTGGTPSRQKTEYFGGNIRWLVSGDIHQWQIFDCGGRITKEGIKHSNANILPVDAVLIALNGQGKTRGTVAILRVEATCNQSLVGMISKNKNILIPEFLLYYLKSKYMDIRRLTGVDDRRGLNMKILGNIEIPLPPLAEQKKIVAYLDSLSAKARQLQELQNKTVEDSLALRQSILHQAFSN